MRLTLVILAVTLLLIIDLSVFGGYWTIELISMAQQSFRSMAHFAAGTR